MVAALVGETTQRESTTRKVPITEIYIGDTETEAMIDTGAEVSVMTSEAWRRLSETEDLPLRPPEVTLTAANELQLQNLGTVTARVTLAGHTTVCDFAIVDQLPNSVIVGGDILLATKATISYDTQEIQTGACTTTPFRFEGKTIKKGCSLTLLESVRIPARTIVNVRVGTVGMRYGKRTPNEAEVLIEEDQDTCCRLGVAVARVVATLRREKTPERDGGALEVRIANLRSATVDLAKGAVIAKAEPLKGARIALIHQGEMASGDELDATTWDDGRCTTLTDEDLDEMVGRSDPTLTLQQCGMLRSLLAKNADLFTAQLSGDTPAGLAKHAPHRIDTGTHVPIKRAPYRVSPTEQKIIETEVEKMLQAGIISPSTSPWAAPVLLVEKADGSVRFCVDYRQLNRITHKDAYPLPRIDDMLDHIGKSTFRSTMDLVSGYWQIPVAVEDREKTAFATRQGTYEFNVMPFGLTNAPATFQRSMDIILAGLNWTNTLVYIDDVVVFSPTFEEHMRDLQVVFNRIRQAMMFLKPRKCYFCRTELHFLGHILTKEGVHTDPQKVASVQNSPRPTSTTELRAFLGMTGYYRRFIKDYAHIAAPLTSRTSPYVRFNWDEECEHAWQELKERLVSAPVLRFPDFERPFLLHTDASDIAIGGVLAQLDDDGAEYVVAYGSRKLNPAEKRYPVHERECLSVIHWIKAYRPYLFGHPFTVFTDCGALQWLRTIKDPTGRLARWTMALERFDYELKHRPGQQNANADALSRPPLCETIQAGEPLQADHESVLEMIPTTISTIGAAATNADLETDEETDEEPLESGSTTEEVVENMPNITETQVLPSRDDLGSVGGGGDETDGLLQGEDSIARAQRSDSELKPIFRFLEKGLLPNNEEKAKKLVAVANQMTIVEGRLYRYWWPQRQDRRANTRLQLVIPPELRKEILAAHHDDLLGGHLGFDRTFDRIRERYWWPTVWKDTKNWVTTCGTCQRRKTPRLKKAGMLKPLPPATLPWERIAIDFIGPWTTTVRGNRFIMVVSDYLTRWPEAFALPDATARTVAKTLFDEIICRHGAPLSLLTDQGPQFTDGLIEGLNELLQIRRLYTTPYHPQTDGLVERLNGTLENIIASFTSSDQKDWDLYIPCALFAYRTSMQESTKETPFYLMYGRDAYLPTDTMLYGRPAAPPTNDEEYKSDLVWRLQHARQIARENTLAAQERQKQYYNSRRREVTYREGDLVMLHVPGKKEKEKTRKLLSPWQGPYRVTRVRNPLVYELTGVHNPNDQPVTHVQRLKPWYQWQDEDEDPEQLDPETSTLEMNKEDSAEPRNHDAPDSPTEDLDVTTDAGPSTNPELPALTVTPPVRPPLRRSTRRRKGGVPYDGEEREIEEILEARGPVGKQQYKVKWYGFDNRSNSWVSATDINAPQLLRDFETLNLRRNEEARGRASS